MQKLDSVKLLGVSINDGIFHDYDFQGDGFPGLHFVLTYNAETNTWTGVEHSAEDEHGDGACFEGSYRFALGAEKQILEYAPQDKELIRIAASLDTLQDGAAPWGELSATVRHRGRYYHEMSNEISVECADDASEDAMPQDEFTRLEDGLVETLRDFMRWIYRRLEAEWDYINSDAQVDENIRANEYEFEADGTPA